MCVSIIGGRVRELGDVMEGARGFKGIHIWLPHRKNLTRRLALAPPSSHAAVVAFCGSPPPPLSLGFGVDGYARCLFSVKLYMLVLSRLLAVEI